MTQDLGLAQSYRDSEEYFCCTIDALAFLPVDQVSDGIQYLFSDAPEGNHDTLIELLTYFDATYVTATARQIHRQRDASNTISVRRIPPLFEPRKWNIHEAAIKDTNRHKQYVRELEPCFQPFRRSCKSIVLDRSTSPAA